MRSMVEGDILQAQHQEENPLHHAASRRGSARWPPSMRMKVRAGMRCTPVGIRAGSIIRSRSRTKAFAPIRPKAISRVCAEWKSVHITISLGRTSVSMRVRLHGVRITGAFPTVRRLRWSPVLLWVQLSAGLGRGIGSERCKWYHNTTMDHVESELARISERLAAYPDPFEHAGLYAAQQALRWAAQPDAFASPFQLITGIRKGSGDCLADSRHSPLPDTDDQMSDAS